MPTANLPDPQTLAALVSNVTQTMCGISFDPAVAQDRNPDLCWRIATLPIDGARPIRVALSSSQEGCTALGAGLFSLPPSDLDQSMIDDALCELLNMAAGQIKTALALDQALGLPKIVGGSDLPMKQERAMQEGVVLKSRGKVDLLIWVSEGD